MMRRGAAAATALILAALLFEVLPAPARASSVLCPTANVSAVNPPVAGAGTTVAVSGSSLASAPGCSATLSIGGQTVSVQTLSSTALSFTAATSLNGPVVLTQADGAGGVNASNNNLVFASIPSVSGAAPRTPTTGQTVVVSGSGFDFPGIGAPPPVTATFTDAGNGGRVCATVAAVARSAAALSFPAPRSDCDGPLQLTFTPVTDTNSGAATPIVASAGNIDVAPAVTGLTPTAAVPGQAVTVAGSGFGTAGTATVGGIAAASTWHDTGITVVVPGAASSGPLVLHRANDGAVISAGALTVQAAVSDISPGAAAVGDTVTISGAGFGTAPGTVVLGSVTLPVSQWSPSSITVSVPGGVSAGQVLVQPLHNAAPLAAPTLTILPRISAADPGHAAGGALVRLIGTSFGSQQGTVRIGATPVVVSLWSDSEVVVTLPATVPPGPASISLLVPGIGTAAAVAFVVDPGAAPSASASASAGAVPIAPAPNGLPTVTRGPVAFHPLRSPPSPIQLTLSPARDQAAPGTVVPFAVTLIAFGKPVPGAAVTVQLVTVPGADARVSLTSTVTDASGQVHGLLSLSRIPGEHVVLARSGIYSDEILVVGGAVPTQLSSTPTAHPAGFPTSLVLVLVVGVMLFLVGLALNLATRPIALPAAARSATAARRLLVGSVTLASAARLDRLATAARRLPARSITRAGAARLEWLATEARRAVDVAARHARDLLRRTREAVEARRGGPRQR